MCYQSKIKANFNDIILLLPNKPTKLTEVKSIFLDSIVDKTFRNIVKRTINYHKWKEGDTFIHFDRENNEVILANYLLGGEYEDE